MSREALNAYTDAVGLQQQRNEARNIRKAVNLARQAPHLAGLRWPFELLQNALDAGPRAGREVVTVLLQDKGGHVVFEHDGAPFSLGELAALLSGGSSKEFESSETTGRFGTGFLVTHVLAEHTTLDGLMTVEGGWERFRLLLDRSGDEDAILANIKSCNNGILEAERIESIDGDVSAHFEYAIERDGPLGAGVDAFRSALPFLYATSRRLGTVTIVDNSGTSEVWVPERPTQEWLQEAGIEERLLCVHNQGVERHYRTVRVSSRDGAAASAIALLESVDGVWHVRLPAASEPRIYAQYPLRASSFVPVEFIFDGGIEPDPERHRPVMSEGDRAALSDAFAAAAIAVRYACSQGWKNGHLLARAEPATSTFDPDNPDEADWWQTQLSEFAGALAEMPIVATRAGYLSATESSGADQYADFVVPRLLDGTSGDETTIERMWPLVDEAADLFPPIEELASDWSRIAQGWHELDVGVSRVTAEVLAGWARGDATIISDLKVRDEPFEWLARFIDLVGECWEHRNGIDASVLAGLLPNQRGDLCDAANLRRDSQVSEALKDLCEAGGLDVRSRLTSLKLTELTSRAELSYAARALENVIPSETTEADVRDELLGYLRSELVEDADCSDANDAAQRASVGLLKYLWDSTGDAAATLAQQVPLIASSRKVVYWRPDRMMMAPVAAWGEAAREFSSVYPPDRVLADLHVESEATVITALGIWGMAHPDPITTSVVRELEDRRLAATLVGDFDSDGVVVRGEEFSQIALLFSAVLNRSQDVEHARALLGLVLCHFAPNDPRWREVRSVKGWKAREASDVDVRGALWVGDLRSRAWVPMRGDDDKPIMVVAEPSTLTPLLDPQWLEGNDAAITLLTDCFDFDELDLRLLGIAPEAQQSVRRSLAKLLESGGSDPEVYQSLAEQLEARQRRQRDVERCRRFGYAVQEAVKEALETHGLSVKLIDRGFDYEVSVSVVDEILEDAAVRFEVGPYFVEVKATSVGPVRLTPMQAGTAASETARYVLCAVDLRGLDDERLDSGWTGADVQPLASMVSDIGDQVAGTCVLVQRARQSSVGIRNEAALRYEVPPAVWELGTSISEWVATISADLATVSVE